MNCHTVKIFLILLDFDTFMLLFNDIFSIIYLDLSFKSFLRLVPHTVKALVSPGGGLFNVGQGLIREGVLFTNQMT